MAALVQGKSSKQVAREFKIDERTVKKAASESQSRRAAQEAMAQLYQEALRGHMNRLNSALDTIIEELQMPEPYVAALAWNMVVLSPNASLEGGEAGSKGGKSSEQDEDVFSDSALLAEHLRNSKAWRALGDWRRAWGKHYNACGTLQIQSIKLLKEVTGLRTGEEKNAHKEPFFYGENAGDLLCRTTVKYLSEGADIERVTGDIIPDEQRGMILYNGKALAEGFKDVTKLNECKDNIIKAIDNLKDSHEAKQVISSFQQLEKILPRARYELRAIRTLGVLAGHCRICRQFGV